MRRIGRLLDALDQVGPVEAVRRQAGLGVAGVLRRLRELDHVLGVRLGVVVRDEDGGVLPAGWGLALAVACLLL